MLSKTHDAPVSPSAPGVIPDTIMSNGAPAARKRFDQASMTFLVFEDNGGLQQRGRDPMTSATLIAPTERDARSANLDSRPADTCPECGNVLRVSAPRRHRVTFELDDERSAAPVINLVCPARGHGLRGRDAR